MTAFARKWITSAHDGKFKVDDGWWIDPKGVKPTILTETPKAHGPTDHSPK